MSYEKIRQQDPQVYESMMRELQRQRDHIELIASENFVSEAVLQAMGSHRPLKAEEEEASMTIEELKELIASGENGVLSLPNRWGG